MIRYYLVLIVLTVLGSFGAYFLKVASSKSDSLIKTLYEGGLYIGGLLYFLSAVLNIYVLQFIDYSIVLPMTSLSYIWTMIIAGVTLKEPITKNKLIGVALIVTGAVLIGLG